MPYPIGQDAAARTVRWGIETAIVGWARIRLGRPSDCWAEI